MGWDFGALVQRGLNLYWHVWTIKGRGDGVGSAVTVLHVECCLLRGRQDTDQTKEGYVHACEFTAYKDILENKHF